MELYRYWAYGLASRGGRRCVLIHPNALYKRPQLCGGGLHKPTIQKGKFIQYFSLICKGIFKNVKQNIYKKN